MNDQQVINLDINQLQANPLQPRGTVTPESLVDLVDSIREHGVLEPLVVAKTPAGYQIIAGERRWRASKLAGQKTVPVIVKETSPQGMLEMAIVENVQRSDLNPIDRAMAFQRLLDEFGLNNAQVSQKIGKSPSYISNSLRLLELPDALKDGLLTGLISEGHARALAAIEDPKMIIEAYKVVLREHASVRRAEDLARRYRAQMGIQPNARAYNNPKSTPHIVSEEIDRMRAEMEKVLGGDELSEVKLSRSRTQTRVTLVLNGSLEETEERLQKIYKGLME
ncbi:MAG: ParB/RepB/Spo0J family partition protein [Patescibacteria group bacterium]